MQEKGMVMDPFEFLYAVGAVFCIDEPGGTGGGEAEKPADKPADEGSDDELGEGGKKALVAERDARKQAEKDRDAALARVKALEEAEKPASDGDALEALKAQVADLVKERDALAAEKATAAIRAEVLDEKEVPERLRKWVTGSTKEELEASADDVLKDFRDENPVTIPGPRKRETAPRKGVDAGGDLYDQLHGKTGN